VSCFLVHSFFVFFVVKNIFSFFLSFLFLFTLFPPFLSDTSLYSLPLHYSLSP
jgi:hypothetical protein